MIRRSTCTIAATVAGIGLFAMAVSGEEGGTLVQFGTMREAIGQKQSQGRVALEDLSGTPHFYGVGALEGLAGEVTFVDSKPTVTGVTDDGAPAPLDGGPLQATMLAGSSVPSWRERAVEKDTPHGGFDAMVREAAAASGLDVARPFVFSMEGEFQDVRLHVIHGACPMHARMQKIELPEDQRPFEGEYGRIHGTLVGIYAEDAVGKLTHPATSTHVHLVYTDPATGATVTGHVERVGVASGAVLRLPM